MNRPEPQRNRRASELHSLLERVTRVVASDSRASDINPAQITALGYLARANRFSRKPSIVAEYLGATRGTVSQTLKALVRKGLVEETPNPEDGRSISYTVTPDGHATLERESSLASVLAEMTASEIDTLSSSLREVLLKLLEAQSYKTFGACRTCAYHEVAGKDRYCRLLELGLSDEEAEQLCAEHTR
ncbi:MAG: MarR family transcriptional regulator [Dinoroseobacter sp.]|nr:MarR family transcriptional regulator [Dinoroseobacter sp.]